MQPGESIRGPPQLRRSSVGLTRPKLGFELGPGEEKGQIGKARPAGEGRKFAPQLDDAGRGALRALDNLCKGV